MVIDERTDGEMIIHLDTDEDRYVRSHMDANKMTYREAIADIFEFGLAKMQEDDEFGKGVSGSEGKSAYSTLTVSITIPQVAPLGPLTPIDLQIIRTAMQLSGLLELGTIMDDRLKKETKDVLEGKDQGVGSGIGDIP